jgi:hypothetical protein
MAFSEVEAALIERLAGGLCRRRNRPELRDKLSLEYSVKGHDVVLFERRPEWGRRHGVTNSPVAKIKFVRSTGEWRLYWMRRDLKWHGYSPLASSRSLEKLLREVEEDSHGCFFG